MALSDDEDEQLQLAIALSKQHPSDTPPSTAPVTNLGDSSDDNDDDELQRAVELSKRHLTNTAPSTAPVIDLVDSDAETEDENEHPGFSAVAPVNLVDDEDEDEDFKRAIALSLQDQGHAESSVQTELEVRPGTCEVKTSADIPTTQKVITTNFLGLDRKAMEQERLARMGKRKREDEPEKPSKMVVRKMSPDRDVAVVERLATKDSQGTDSIPDPKSTSKKAEESQDHSSLRYPKGVVKRTWAFKHPRTNDIKIEELVQKETLKIAVLSSFDFDAEWAYEKIDPYKHKQVWIMNAKGKDIQDNWRETAVTSRVPNLRVHFPPMEGSIQKMHSKLMLLIHGEHMRIVVPTANWTKYDWGETNKTPGGHMWQGAVMENSAFIVDVPRRKDGEIGNSEDLTGFGKQLLQFLEAQELSENVSRGILKFDLSSTQHLGFVHSIGGSHSDGADKRTGFPGLRTTLRRLGLAGAAQLEIDYASSSLGALNPTFLKQMYEAAGGAAISETEVLKRWRIYFPSKQTVEQSTGGADCGGTITLNRAYWNAATFPKQCLREYKSTRSGVLSHNKILLARGTLKDGKPFAWAYVGSANLSESAWGRQKVLKSGKLGKLVIPNWECGVVVPVPGEVLEKLELGKGEVPPMSVFEGTIEVPFQYPGEEYGGKEPWFFRD